MVMGTLKTYVLKGKRNQMVVWSYPPTAKQVAATATIFVIGASFISVGAYLSYANIAPQQARTKARSEAIKKQLRKFLHD
ncbi:hypothetical protein Lal_00040462 [Lupinus albus]|uniref:Uncharacterized protein n=1 Tax=Lupinus albus TaxID=3870 RepID=A0A6A5LKN6_LUPAL|nr:hypothetical protein Lalb_Chr21g0315921 [Lupinus albus]KAF1860180.1 hypothetical protein Lal_00040462 [Lupinus albus]